ncbi:MAG: MFS transporter [Pseudomonadota bacterium]
MDQSSGRRRRAAFALVPGLVAFSMGQTVLFAVAGPVIRDIGLSEFQLGMIVSAAAVMFMLASPIWGRLSDSWGRKRVIVFGLFTYALTSFAFAATMQIGLQGTFAVIAIFVSLLGIRLLYAALGAGIQPSSVALMADLSEEKDRSSAVAIIGASFGFGMILGPAAAALLVGFGILTPLYAIAGLGLIFAFIAAFFLEDTPSQQGDKTEKSSVDYARLLPVMLIAILLFTGVSGMQQTIAFYVQDYLQVDSEEAARMTGVCFVAMAVASLAVQAGVIQVLKPGAETLLRIGLPLMLAGVAIYALPSGFWQIILGCAIIGAGYGFATPGIMAAASVRSDSASQGASAGLVQAMMAGGYIFGPLAGTAGYERTPLTAAVIVAACVLGAIMIAYTLRAKQQGEPAADPV